MRLKLFSICEGAYNNNGRLTIVNTYDIIGTKEFPLVMALGLAITIEFDLKDVGKHGIELHVVNQSNKMEIAKMVSEFVVPQDKSGGYFNFASNVNGFTFKEEANYSYNLYIDGKLIGNVIIPVKKVK